MHIRRLFDLTGRVAIVTGGATGLGRQMAEALADAGAKLVLCSRNKERCDSAAAELQSAKGAVARRQQIQELHGPLGGARDTATVLREFPGTGAEVLSLGCDVKKAESIQNVVAETVDRFGRIDILINNAGTSWGAPMEEMKLEQWNKVMDTNMTGAFLFCQAVGKVMISQKRGKIINIASVAGLRGSQPEFQAIGYQTSKGALIAFTKDLACKWAMHNINVNAIAPGWFPTNMSSAVISRNPDSLLDRIPLHRFGGKHDLKGAAVFLASDASDFVTGHTLVVDGGQTAW